VDLTIDRRGEQFEVTITRGEIPIKSVFASMLGDEHNIGYLKITNFGEETDSEVEEKLSELRSQGMQALMVDVRNNPGGSLRSAYEVADEWIDEGRIVYTRGRAPGQDKDYPAHAENTQPDYPMTILGNRGSASGSEILVGALKDHKRAVVMGDTTFGKGLVQSVFPLQDGSALALTTARYFTPDGHMIQGTGIPPQISIEQTLPDTGVQKELARLNSGDTVLNFVQDHQPVDEDDIQKLVDELRSEGFTLDERYIRNAVRRQKLAMEGKTMVASPSTDPQLRKALDYFRDLLENNPSGPTANLDPRPEWL
jgi:C-terminal peptidase prc